MMTTALPFAPGGLGVGHYAFDRLFELAGLTRGADVFNVVVLGQLALNLTGVVPYLLHRRQVQIESESSVNDLGETPAATKG